MSTALLASCMILAGTGDNAPRAYGPRMDWHSTTPAAMKRAGCPQLVSKRAVPTNTPNYTGYYVGGGAASRKGEPRFAHEGTFGWDYQGPRWLPRRVSLNWWHDRKQQGGVGAYKTDGPHVPDVPNAVRPIKKVGEEH